MNGFNWRQNQYSCDYLSDIQTNYNQQWRVEEVDWQIYIALIFSCFILGCAFFFSLLFSLSSIFLCLSGSSISLKHQTISTVHHYLRTSYLILSLISRFFFSLSSAAFSAFTAWIDFQ